ncbi:MAG: hypothetical protein WCO30_01775 [bacterium]
MNNNFINKNRYGLSILVAFLSCIVWAVIIFSSINSMGGDDGLDPFGFGHIIFFFISVPFVFFLISQLFYSKIFKTKNGEVVENSEIDKVHNNSITTWVVILFLIPVIVFLMALGWIYL